MTEPLVVKIDVAAEASATVHPFAEATWLIWSNVKQMWWGPDQRDYTHNQAEAGRYPWAEAMEIFARTNRGWDPSTSCDLPSVFLAVLP